jgi:hypothetical protein
MDTNELERMNAKMQRVIGWLLFGIFTISLTMNIVNAVWLPPSRQAGLRDWLLEVLAPILFLLSALVQKKGWQLFQSVTLMAFGLLGNVTNLPAHDIRLALDAMMCEMLVIFGFVTFSQYNHRHPLANRILAGTLIAINAALFFVLEPDHADIALAFSLFLAILLIFFDWVLAQKFRFFQQARDTAEREKASLVTFANLGLAVNAVTHDVQGRIALQRNLVRQMGQTTDPGRRQELVALLDRSCTELLGFTDELRAKLIEDDRGIRAFDLKELVRNLSESLRAAFGVNLETSCSPWSGMSLESKSRMICSGTVS